MARNVGDFGGKSGKTMKLKSLKTRDDMSIVGEDYHAGVSASVPFMWESEPGTPKANFREHGALLSPLTPPPSYFSSNAHTPLASRHNSKPSSRTNFLNTVFRKLSAKPTLQPLSPGSSSSSSASSRETGRGASPIGRLSFDSKADDDDDEEENVESPVSTLFFGRGGATDKGCYPKLVKVFTRDFK